MEGRDVVQDGEHHRSDSGERQKEAYGSDKEPPSRPVGNALMNRLPERRSMKQQEYEGNPSNGEQENEPGVGHVALDRMVDRTANAIRQRAQIFFDATQTASQRRLRSTHSRFP